MLSLAVGLFLVGCLTSTKPLKDTATHALAPEDGPHPKSYKDNCTVVVAVTTRNPGIVDSYCRAIVKKDDLGRPIADTSVFFGCTRALFGLVTIPTLAEFSGIHWDFQKGIGHEVQHVLDFHCGVYEND